jgi:dienelactone hydrolase
VVVPEWWGVNEYVKRRGRMLAELGYAAFVADMYGDGKVTTDAAQAGEWAGAVRGDRALMRERVNAAVAAARQQDVVDDAKVAAIGYCFGGTTVLELALSGSDVKGVASFHGGLDFPSLENDAGNVKSQVLVLHGAADPMVPPAQVEALEKALTDAGVKHEIVQYEGAVHSFTNPDAGKAGIDGVEYHEQADKESWEKLQEFLKQIFG